MSNTYIIYFALGWILHGVSLLVGVGSWWVGMYTFLVGGNLWWLSAVPAWQFNNVMMGLTLFALLGNEVRVLVAPKRNGESVQLSLSGLIE